MLKIVIPDPGLREFGGHHPAMISSLSNSSKLVEGEMNIDIYCHVECDNKFIRRENKKNIIIKKHFKTNFYQYFYQDLNFSEMNAYILCLTKEYVAVFEHYIDKRESELLFLYHTLNWEHAMALGSAISIVKKRYHVGFSHCVFLMFNPEQQDFDNGIKKTRFLNFKMAFRTLEKLKNVNCFAGDYELANKYKQLLKSKIELHPCGLLSKIQVAATDNVLIEGDNSKKFKIILYTGDVKANKGFLRLPSIIDRLISEIKYEKFEFLIQYTLTNNNPDLVKIDSVLKVLAGKDNRITLINSFLSHSELHSNYVDADCILFNYDKEIYKNQSSGVLWLAAQHKLKMIFLTDTWLNREAERLNCQYSMCIESDIPTIIEKYISEVNNDDQQSVLNRFSSHTHYRETLFQDSATWLYNKYYRI